MAAFMRPLASSEDQGATTLRPGTLKKHTQGGEGRGGDGLGYSYRTMSHKHTCIHTRSLHARTVHPPAVPSSETLRVLRRNTRRSPIRPTENNGHTNIPTSHVELFCSRIHNMVNGCGGRRGASGVCGERVSTP